METPKKETPQPAKLPPREPDEDGELISPDEIRRLIGEPEPEPALV